MARYEAGLRTRERILAAVRDELGETGLDGLTLKAVTDRAEVGPGSFYNLFDSKEAAVLEVVGEAITAVDPDPSGSGRDRLGDLVDAFVRFVVEQRTLATIYLQVAVAGALSDEDVNERVRRSHRRRVERFAEAVRHEVGGIGAAAAARAAETIVASLTGYAIIRLVDPDFDLAGHARRLAANPVGLVAATR